jgi:hypothetical protein
VLTHFAQLSLKVDQYWLLVIMQHRLRAQNL